MDPFWNVAIHCSRQFTQVLNIVAAHLKKSKTDNPEYHERRIKLATNAVDLLVTLASALGGDQVGNDVKFFLEAVPSSLFD